MFEDPDVQKRHEEFTEQTMKEALERTRSNNKRMQSYGIIGNAVLGITLFQSLPQLDDISRILTAGAVLAIMMALIGTVSMAASIYIDSIAAKRLFEWFRDSAYHEEHVKRGERSITDGKELRDQQYRRWRRNERWSQIYAWYGYIGFILASSTAVGILASFFATDVYERMQSVSDDMQIERGGNVPHIEVIQE